MGKWDRNVRRPPIKGVSLSQLPLWVTGTQPLWGSSGIKCQKHFLKVILREGKGSWGIYSPTCFTYGWGLLQGTFISQYFVCLQSSKVGSGDKKTPCQSRADAAVGSWAGVHWSIRVSRCRWLTNTTATMILQLEEVGHGERIAEDKHTHSHIYTYINI